MALNIHDPRTLQSVNSLRDRIYQRSFNIRKTFIELDQSNTGSISFDDFVAEMTRQFQLSEFEQRCLHRMLLDVDYDGVKQVTFKKFIELLKIQDNSSSSKVLSDDERRRFKAKGLMDSRMQSIVINDTHNVVKIGGALPTNELGHMTIDCPFGVLGDSERMDAVISTYLQLKLEGLRAALSKHDDDNDGYVTYEQFRAGMKAVDQYVFDDEIDQLLSILDKKRKGKISISEFLLGSAGKEYLKKKAHRSNCATENPFVWETPDKPKRSMSTSAKKESSAPMSVFKKPMGATRASEMRMNDARLRLLEMTKRDDYEAQARLYAGTGVESPRNTTVKGSPRGGEQQGTPRLPAINSARR